MPQGLGLAQQLRQLCDVDCDPPRHCASVASPPIAGRRKALTRYDVRRRSGYGFQQAQDGRSARRQAAEKEAAARRATEAQILEDAERLIAAWNERMGERRAGGPYDGF
jgi:hypothetical protein